MVKKLFGTDGIRGRAHHHPITTQMAQRLGHAVPMALNLNGKRMRALISRDTRESGVALESSLANALVESGAEVLLTGVLPSSGCALLTRRHGCDAGILVSASHNPPSDNGLKFFLESGLKFDTALERQVERHLDAPELSHRSTSPAPGAVRRLDTAAEEYVQFLRTSAAPDMDLKGLRLALDCANGAAYHVAPLLFETLGATTRLLGVQPDGRNINLDCGSVHPAALAAELTGGDYAFGAAFDGDADRAVFVDNTGCELPGETIIGIVALDMLRRGVLRNRGIAVTIMSNSGLDRTIEDAGGFVVRTPVGDRHVINAMNQFGFAFGGEPSGHFIFLEHTTCGDGILAVLHVLAIMRRTGKSLAELANEIQRYPQVVCNVPIRVKRPFSEAPLISQSIKEGETRLRDKGRIVVRYSGTQPVCRVLAEGEDIQELNSIVAEITYAIEQALQ